MKFKTTIQIVTEADNKNDALEIVGEYLSGYLASGVDMKCSTKRARVYHKLLIGIAAASLLITIAVLSITNLKPSENFIGNTSSINAVQPPLRTSPNANEVGFKKKWQAEHTREALNHIKK